MTVLVVVVEITVVKAVLRSDGGKRNVGGSGGNKSGVDGSV